MSTEADTVEELIATAIALHDAGASARAEAVLGRVLAADPDNVLALYGLGRVLRDTGRAAEALAPLRRCHDLVPANATVGLSLAVALSDAGRPEDAATLLDGLLGSAPDAAPQLEEALCAALAAAGHKAYVEHRFADSAAFYTRLAALRPEGDGVMGSLGGALLRAGDPAGAEAALRRALEQAPGDERWLRPLAESVKLQGRLDEAKALYRRIWTARRASRWWPGPPERGDGSLHTRATLTKLRHDVEQFEHLAGLGLLPAEAAPSVDALRRLRDAVAAEGRKPTEPFDLTEAQAIAVRDVYNRIVRLAEPDTGPGPVLNPAVDWRAVEAEFHANTPGFAVIDGLLSPEALAALRRYCLESTFWFDLDHAGGYLGAYLSEGFDADLLVAIVRELQQALPDVLGGRPLRELWAYKYDQRLEGIPPHADEAAVNVNLWIAPDDACTDPEGGGLLVYPVEVPRDWRFADYNTINPKFEAFLRERGSAPRRIAHRQNRAMVFTSKVVHASERVDFRPGYENRRINITLLFGDRRADGK
mgnify:CR=1 FL=1